MSNGNQHDHDPLPILVAGGASGQLKGDRHLAFPAHTPMSNLMLSLLDKLGLKSVVGDTARIFAWSIVPSGFNANVRCASARSSVPPSDDEGVVLPVPRSPTSSAS